jgi:hypothetical protein
MAGFNHRIRPSTERDREYSWSGGAGCRNGKRCPGAREVRPSYAPDIPRSIGGVIVWIGMFDYVTGRSGRVSTRRVELCDPCARAWAEKHGLALGGMPACDPRLAALPEGFEHGTADLLPIAGAHTE